MAKSLISNREWLEQIVNLAVAVREFVDPHACFVHQREVQVSQRRRFVELDISIAFEPGGFPSRNDDGQVRVVMYVWITHAASVQIYAVVQQRAFAFGCLG